MKKSIYLFVIILFLSSAVSQPVLANDELPKVSTEQQQARLEQIKQRLQEIKELDKSKLTPQERKAVRKELKIIKKEVKHRYGEGSVAYVLVIGLLVLLWIAISVIF